MTDIAGIDLDELAGKVDAACERASGWHKVSRNIQPARGDDKVTPAAAMAFDYMLQHPRMKGDSDSTFVPMWSSADGESYPPNLADVPADQLSIWSELCPRVQSAIAVARYADLLFEARNEPVGERGRSAASAYLRLGKGDWGDLERSECLLRALDVSRRIKDQELMASVASAILEAATQSLVEDPKPGVALPLIEALVELQRPESDALLETADGLFRAAYLQEHVLELQRKRAGGEQQRTREIDRRRVEAWLAEAEAADGLVKVVHLQKAAQLAQDLGQTDLADRARQLLQATNPDDLELKKVSAEATIPPEALEAYISQFTAGESLRDALVRFVAAGPATGDLDSNRESVAKAKAEFPLRYLTSRVRVGGDGLPRWTPATETDQEDMDLADHELLGLQVQGHLLAKGLWAIGERYREEIGESLETTLMEFPNVDESTARRLGRAFNYFFEEDFTAGGFVVVPLIEALARGLVLAAQAPVYQTQRASRPGQYPGLGFLLGQLKQGGLDPSWYRCLWTVLASPAGLNYRNELAHGFVGEVVPVHLAVLLQIATYLGMIEVQGADPQPD